MLMWSSSIRVPVLARPAVAGAAPAWRSSLLRSSEVPARGTPHPAPCSARGTGGSARRVKAQPPDRPDPRHALPGPRPGLLRAPARHPPPDRPPNVGKLGTLGFEVTLVRVPESGPDGTGQTQAA